jgi:hypothetical protein
LKQQGITKSVTVRSRYKWLVVMKDSGDNQHGTVDSFQEAMDALRAWHGDGSLQDVQAFLICPIITIVKEDKNESPT